MNYELNRFHRILHSARQQQQRRHIVTALQLIYDFLRFNASTIQRKGPGMPRPYKSMFYLLKISSCYLLLISCYFHDQLF